MQRWTRYLFSEVGIRKHSAALRNGSRNYGSPGARRPANYSGPARPGLANYDRPAIAGLIALRG